MTHGGERAKEGESKGEGEGEGRKPQEGLKEGLVGGWGVMVCVARN